METQEDLKKHVVYIRLLTKDLRYVDPYALSDEIKAIIGRDDLVLRSFGSVIKVICKDIAEQNVFLKIKRLCNIDITCSKPQGRPDRKRVVIVGVPFTITEERILKDTKCLSVRRLRKRTKDGLVQTTAVSLDFILSEVPKNIYLDYLKFTPRPYIAEPIRCFNCNGYGHRSSVCTRPAKCGWCSGKHSSKECQNKKEEIKRRCPNCGQSTHSAGSKQCVRQQIHIEAAKIVATQNTSYRDALLKGKQVVYAERKMEKPKQPTLNQKCNEQKAMPHEKPKTYNTGEKRRRRTRQKSHKKVEPAEAAPIEVVDVVNSAPSADTLSTNSPTKLVTGRCHGKNTETNLVMTLVETIKELFMKIQTMIIKHDSKDEEINSLLNVFNWEKLGITKPITSSN